MYIKINHRFCLSQNSMFRLIFGCLLSAFLTPLAAVAEPIPSQAAWRAMSNQEKAAQGNLFFSGCKVESLSSPANTRLIYTVVQGSCLGHKFTREGTQFPNACIINTQDSADLGTVWVVGNCNYDGEEVGGVLFNTNRQQVVLRSSPDWLKMLSSWDSEVKKLFVGCTTTTSRHVSIEGKCLGHTFSRDRSGVTHDMACQISKDVGVPPVPMWNVTGCNYDGVLINQVTFRADTGQQIGTAVPKPNYSSAPIVLTTTPATPALMITEQDKQYCDGQVQKHLRMGGIPSGVGYVFSMCMKERSALANGRLVQAEAERKEAEYKQQQLKTHQQEVAQICPTGAQLLSSVVVKQPSMYGLAINMPMPCLQFCKDELKQGKARMCVNDLSSNPLTQTGWGTTSFEVVPNDDVFDSLERVRTGLPTVEVANGKVVGLVFDGGRYRPEDWLQALIKKFGKYKFSGNVYSWETSTSSARLVTETRTQYSTVGQVDLDHLFGEGIEGNDYDAAKFSVYVPAIRARREAFETAEELKNRKEGF